MTTKQWFQGIVTLIIAMFVLWGAVEFCYFVQGNKLEKKEQAQRLTITRSITTDVRAYCKCKECCKRWANGTFANGEDAQGRAVASVSLARGTKLFVPGYGLAVVKDHGPNLVEVFFEKHEDAVYWGVKRDLIVEILE